MEKAFKRPQKPLNLTLHEINSNLSVVFLPDAIEFWAAELVQLVVKDFLMAAVEGACFIFLPDFLASCRTLIGGFQLTKSVSKSWTNVEY